MSATNEATGTAKEQAGAVAGTAKEQAGAVAGTAKEQAGAVAGTAKEQAGAVAGTAGQAARDVVDTAKDQAATVAGEVGAQARDLIGETREELRTQAQGQTRRLAQTVRSLADEVHGMASGTNDQPGPATDLAHQLADRAQAVSEYLESASPEDLLDDLRQFARRRTGLFLFAAGTAGFLAARLAKASQASKDSGPQQLGTYRSTRPAPLPTAAPTLQAAPTERAYYGEVAVESPSPATSAMSGDLPASAGTGYDPTTGYDPAGTTSTQGYGAPTIEPPVTGTRPVDPLLDDERGSR